MGSFWAFLHQFISDFFAKIDVLIFEILNLVLQKFRSLNADFLSFAWNDYLRFFDDDFVENFGAIIGRSYSKNGLQN